MDREEQAQPADGSAVTHLLEASQAALEVWERIAVPLLLGHPLTPEERRDVTDFANRMQALREALSPPLVRDMIRGWRLNR